MSNDKERKYIYIVIVVIIVILLFVLICIWSPLFKNKSLKNKIGYIEKKDDNSYNTSISQEFLNKSKSFIEEDNVENTINFIDDDFLNKNKLDKNSVIDYLKDNKLVGPVTSSTNLYLFKVQKGNGKYIYTYRYNLGSGEKQIHFIEDYYKNYTISFEQGSFASVVKGFTYEDKDKSISYDVSVLAAYENSISIQVNLKNNSNDIYKIILDSINDATVNLTDGSEYNLSTIVIGSNASEVNSTPNSTINFNLSLNVPLENQSMIKKVTLNNVIKNNFETSNLIINF